MEKSISQIIKDVEEITVCENSKNPLRDERIVLNVGGIKYETCRSTLTAYPDTLLGTMFHQRNKEMLHPTNGNEYFIDRNGYAFYYILEFYRTGRILWKDDMLNTSLFPLIIPQSIETDNNIGSMSNIDINTGNINNNNNNHNSNDNLNNCDDNNRQLPNHFVPHLNHISLLDLEDEFNYFQIPYTSKHDLAEKAAGKLLDDFAYAIEELICLAISKLIDRIAITFYRDGSKVECKLIDNHNNGYHHNSNLLSTKYFNASGSGVGSGGSSNGGGVGSGSNGSGSNNNNNDIVTNGVNDNNINHNNNNSSSISVNNINNDNNDNSDSFNSIYGNFKGNIVRSKVSNNFSDNCYYFHRLNDYSLNGYCIVNHFYDDIKKYLESNFPNMIIKLDFGSNYKSLTLSMSHLFTRDTIKKHSKIGMLKDQKE